ncbi:glycoside hydrolase family 3 N-terminal domain-containing protein [Aegicerativicinus sediminis]
MNKIKIIWLLLILVVLISCKDTENEITSSENKIYLDASAKTEDRIVDLMSRMSLEDKAAQMSQYVGLEHMREALGDLTEEELDKNDAKGFYPGFKTTDIAKLAKEGKIGSFLHVLTAEEANELQQLASESPLKIPLLIGIDAIHGNAYYRGGATVYPTPITQAATFDDALLKKASEQTAIEMRATGTQWTFTPNIDVLRDPRWGRTGETYGEDPFLVGNMGVAAIKGLQGDDFSGNNHVIACAKHLIAGSQSINGLNASPTDVSKRTLFEIFLPPYRRAAQEANVFSIMAAHNEVNGMPGHMDSYMMTDLMRKRWGFNGFYVSDWNDISRIANWHHVAKDFKESVLFSVNAGMDMNMHGPYFQDYVVELVHEGKLNEERVDEAVYKILEAKFRLGLFENPYVDLDEIKSKIFTEEHKETALEQARKGVVLQKNDGFLPLKNLSGKKLFITGPNADNMTILGDWSSPQPEENYITIYEGIYDLASKYNFSTEYYDCGQRSKWITNENISTAKKKAEQSDIVILVLGENSYRHDWKNKTTGENIDRATLALSGNQLKLAKAILETGKPVIVVYVSGSPISEPWLEENVEAVINSWEPGAFGGQAVAEILMGEINPSGKLPLTIPRSVGQLQMVYNHKPTAYIHKYNTEKKTPLHPFGFGLSYTTFEISEPVLSKTELGSASEVVKATVTIKNTGNMEGEEVIQLYIRDNISSFTRPVKELKGYKRVHLKPGESKSVTLEISVESLAFYDEDYNFVIEPGDFTIMTGNSSSDGSLKKVTLSVPNLIKLKE